MIQNLSVDNLTFHLTKLEFEPIHSKSRDTVYKANIVTKRNDSVLNNHQHL